MDQSADSAEEDCRDRNVPGRCICPARLPVINCALAIESVYSTVTDAVHNRVCHKVGPLHHLLSPLLLYQLKPRIGVTPEQLRPIDHVDDIDCPILILSGDADRHCTVDETRRMFAAAREPKSLHLFPGAGHVDLYAYDQAVWSQRVLTFLETSFRDDSQQDCEHLSLTQIVIAINPAINDEIRSGQE